MRTLYQTKVVAIGGRDGHVRSEDGIIDLDVRKPKSMGGPDGAYTNPEQLFAAGYSACFGSALMAIAAHKHLKIESKVTATVGLQVSETDGYSITAAIDVAISGVEKDVALDLLALAHATCPYSKATRNNVDVRVNLVEA
jgi:lipoyl-dependent peroxiredoxin